VEVNISMGLASMSHVHHQTLTQDPV
jgi:hypothetical protein